MLSFNLMPIFKARQIERPYTFLVKAGIAPHTATRILNSKVKVMRLDHIEILCQALHCEPGDLLIYKPNPDHKIPENHPLNKLLPKKDDLSWQETFKTVPLSRLKEIGKMIAEEK